MDFDSALSVDGSQLVGRLTLVRPGVVELRVLESQGHDVFVNGQYTLRISLDLLAVLKPSNQQQHSVLNTKRI